MGMHPAEVAMILQQEKDSELAATKRERDSLRVLLDAVTDQRNQLLVQQQRFVILAEEIEKVGHVNLSAEWVAKMIRRALVGDR